MTINEQISSLEKKVKELEEFKERTDNRLSAQKEIANTDRIQTLSNKVLKTPVIDDFNNATHTHSGTSMGGKLSCESALSGAIRSSSEVFFDSTAGYYDFDAQVNLHSQRTDVSLGHKPAVYVQVTGSGDVTQINDYKIGIKSVAADKVGITSAGRGSLIGLLATVIPLIARTTPNYDDAVSLAITNEGTAKATEGIYIDHNANVAGGKDFAVGVNIACNADYGMTIQGVVTEAIRIPNNRGIFGRNSTDTNDLAIAMIDTLDQIVLGSPSINNIYGYGTLSVSGNMNTTTLSAVTVTATTLSGNINTYGLAVGATIMGSGTPITSGNPADTAQGTIMWDANYIYVKTVASSGWKRAAISGW